MFAYIDSLGPWIEMLAFLVLGIWLGRRWARVQLQAKCDARNCDTIQTMRKNAMKLSADKMKVEEAHERIRQQNLENIATIHSLKTSNGIMGKEIQSLTYQLPRPTRRMVA